MDTKALRGVAAATLVTVSVGGLLLGVGAGSAAGQAAALIAALLILGVVVRVGWRERVRPIPGYGERLTVWNVGVTAGVFVLGPVAGYLVGDVAGAAAGWTAALLVWALEYGLLIRGAVPRRRPRTSTWVILGLLSVALPAALVHPALGVIASWAVLAVLWFTKGECRGHMVAVAALTFAPATVLAANIVFSAMQAGNDAFLAAPGVLSAAGWDLVLVVFVAAVLAAVIAYIASPGTPYPLAFLFGGSAPLASQVDPRSVRELPIDLTQEGEHRVLWRRITFTWGALTCLVGVGECGVDPTAVLTGDRYIVTMTVRDRRRGATDRHSIDPLIATFDAAGSLEALLTAFGYVTRHLQAP